MLFKEWAMAKYKRKNYKMRSINSLWIYSFFGLFLSFAAKSWWNITTVTTMNLSKISGAALADWPLCSAITLFIVPLSLVLRESLSLLEFWEDCFEDMQKWVLQLTLVNLVWALRLWHTPTPAVRAYYSNEVMCLYWHGIYVVVSLWIHEYIIPQLKYSL